MFTVRSLHVAFEIWGVVFCLIFAVCLYSGIKFESNRRRIILYMQLCTAILLLMDAFAWIYRGYPGKIGYYMVRISNFVVFIMSDVAVFLYHIYVCIQIYPDEKANNKNILIKYFSVKKYPVRVWGTYIIFGVSIIFVIISQFTNLYYYFDSENYYHRNAMHPLSLVFAIIIMIMDFTLLIEYRKKIKKEIFISMLSYIVLPAIAAFILLFYYGASLVNIAISISMVIIFIVEMVSQNKALVEREKEIYDLKTRIMISQIGPHFISNTLTTIKYLCKTDQKMAVDTIDEFARYLRGNIESLTYKKPIAFSDELEHVKNYISIEKKRFGDRVNVEYDIETSAFRIPALTLQPLVENAVKHGITKKTEGGVIKIQTKETEEYIEIIIKDNGVGFDTSIMNNDDKIHIGIDNVKERIGSMCSGYLEYESDINKGTEVRIYLPKQN